MCMSESRVAGELFDVHDRVELRLRRNRGNRDHQDAGGSRQEVSQVTGKLCEIKGVRRLRQCSGLR